MTFLVEPVAERAAFWRGPPKTALARAIPLLCAAQPPGDVGAAIQSLAESRVSAWCGTSPATAWASRCTSSRPFRISQERYRKDYREGMVLAVEPMLNEGAPDVLSLRDGWTVVTRRWQAFGAIRAHGGGDPRTARWC